MKVLIVVGEHLFHYQKYLITELCQLNALEIYVLESIENGGTPRQSKWIKWINDRFPVFKVSSYSFEKASDFMKKDISVQVHQESLTYDFVLNFCEVGLIEEYKIKYHSVIKLQRDFKKWYAASINEMPYTIIHLLSSTDNEDFVRVKSLSFSTERGIYNNSDKAFYYFAYLVKSLFNGQEYEVKETVEGNYSILKSWIYHGKLLLIVFKRQFVKVQFNWKIAVLENREPHIINNKAGDFWADPFVVNEGEKTWIFFEEFDRDFWRGKISVLQLDKKNILEKRTVLEQPYHLSFPNVFKIADDYFMLPEESESGSQNIYRATSFPFQWEKCAKILSDVKVVDPVFIFREGRYWLFFNKIEDFEYENNERLSLYSSADLFSAEWKSHPQNPIVIDKSNARNAGKIRLEDGSFMRVSQNCKTTYGAHIFKNIITQLNEEIYREEKVLQSWNLKTFYGCHTINSEEEITVIDLLVKEKKKL